MSADQSDLLASVRTYYSGKLAEFGRSPRGVDWNSLESQRTRFEQLLRICDLTTPCRIGDYGCGYGALYEYLRALGFPGEYRGFDIAPAMIAEAQATYPNDPRAKFDTDERVLSDCDYVVASGVLNVRLHNNLADWEAYVSGVIDRLAALGRRGFAFNALTIHSDPDRMRPDLYYADPCAMFELCRKKYSRWVALLHDYQLYEFTILIRR